MVRSIKLLRNIGRFENVDAGADLRFSKLTLVYAENARGKTTIASVFRSLATGSPAPLLERQRLLSPYPPHVVIDLDGEAPAVFQDGQWSRTQPNLVVFDDTFVSENVCSGIDVDSQHRQNLHELIVGAQGVRLHKKLQDLVATIEDHNRELRAKAQAIPTDRMGGLSVDAFCALELSTDLPVAIENAERRLSAARSSAAIIDAPIFPNLTLPAIDISELEELLARGLADIDTFAVEQVQKHIADLGAEGESWIGDGVGLALRLQDSGHDKCPFCAQSLQGVSLINHYRGYFSENYKVQMTGIRDFRAAFVAAHDGDVPAAFERRVRETIERREFWKAFASVPDSEIDTARIARSWKAAREGVLKLLGTKQAAPLESVALTNEVRSAIQNFEAERDAIALTMAELSDANDELARVKEMAREANVSALTNDLRRLRAIEARFDGEVASRCDAYVAEKASKRQTEEARDAARRALDEYRQDVFPAFGDEINKYLQRFNVNFRIGQFAAVNHRGGSAANYTVLIDNVAVDLAGTTGSPSFRSTLSSGDRNTLALAFFFASLDRDPGLENTVIVIDDPMTSLDEHRTLHTFHELDQLVRASAQMIVLSHSKPFLLGLWEQCRQVKKMAIRIIRGAAGSTLTAWEPTDDMVTQHDHRYALALSYLNEADPASERHVAESLRPMMEAFTRVAYPQYFRPGSKLGQFHELCRVRLGTDDEILTENDAREFREILNYANRFHHDENDAYETEIINDTELTDFTRRTIEFIKK